MAMSHDTAILLLDPQSPDSYFEDTATRPALLQLDNERPLEEMERREVRNGGTRCLVTPSMQVLMLHPAPSAAARSALAHMGCHLETSSTAEGRRRLLHNFVDFKLFNVLQHDFSSISGLTVKMEQDRLSLINPDAVLG